MIRSRVKSAHSLSNPRVPSVPTQRLMVSAKPEGLTTLKQKFRVHEYEQVGNAPESDESRARRDE